MSARKLRFFSMLATIAAFVAVESLNVQIKGFDKPDSPKGKATIRDCIPSESTRHASTAGTLRDHLHGRTETARRCQEEKIGQKYRKRLFSSMPEGAKEEELSQACQRLPNQAQDVLLLLRR